MNTNERSAEEIVSMDLESIYIGNLNTVDENLHFPKAGKNGSKFSWTSGEERFIEDNGVVHRPLHGMGNRKVILTVRAEYEECVKEQKFEATVLQEAKETIIAQIRDVAVSANIGEAPQLPSVVIGETIDGRRVTLPVKWESCEVQEKETQIHLNGEVEGCEIKAKAEVQYCKEIGKDAGPEQKGGFFPITQVRLKEGTLFDTYQKRMLEFLIAQNDDQMLYNFRKAAGLDTLEAPPMTGWDEESCKLKGHTTGHYLSGLALAWGATGNQRFLDKIVYMVDALESCQHAFEKSGKCQKGFLSAYSEEQFDLLEQFTKYPEIWAPYYTLDKIMSGLYDCLNIAGVKKAGEILDKMGSWVYHRLSRLSKETLDKMWSMYIAGEFGGMLGTMVKLYRITKKEEHLKAAKLFSNEKLFYPMEQNIDTLEDMHANQHIPQIIGAMDLFEATGDATYWKIGKHFWEIVTGGHIYCIGGTGETEMFHRAGTICNYLTEKAAESCASYNLLRLTAQIYAYTMDGNMMDYYDNTLRNHILTSCSHTADGGTTYFMPLNPGGVKEYGTTENTCCHGTGMESRFRYMEHIYAYDEENIYINLWVDSVLRGEINLEQTFDEVNGRLRIGVGSNLNRKLKIHVPQWVECFSVIVNGTALEGVKKEHGYIETPGVCHEGDEIEIQFAMELRVLENPYDETLVNIAFGPYILAAVSEEKEYLTAPELGKLHPLVKQNHFEANGVEYLPFPEIDNEAYHVYLKKYRTGNVTNTFPFSSHTNKTTYCGPGRM